FGPAGRRDYFTGALGPAQNSYPSGDSHRPAVELRLRASGTASPTPRPPRRWWPDAAPQSPTGGRCDSTRSIPDQAIIQVRSWLPSRSGVVSTTLRLVEDQKRIVVRHTGQLSGEDRKAIADRLVWYSVVFEQHG